MQITIVDRSDMLTKDLRETATRRLLFALSRFDSRIEQVRLVVSDVNGPRGGTDKFCRISVNLRRLPAVTVANQDADVRACLAKAADRAGRAVLRAIERGQQFDRRRPLSIPTT